MLDCESEIYVGSLSRDREKGPLLGWTKEQSDALNLDALAFHASSIGQVSISFLVNRIT
jgi:hypothetical protein